MSKKPNSVSNQIAVVGIVAILHLWVFAGLLWVQPSPVKVVPVKLQFVQKSSAKTTQSTQGSQQVSAASSRTPAEPQPELASEPEVDPNSEPVSEPASAPAERLEVATQTSGVQAASDNLDQKAAIKPDTPTQDLLETDQSAINLEVLAAVNSTIEQEAGAQTQVDSALDSISAKPKLLEVAKPLGSSAPGSAQSITSEGELQVQSAEPAQSPQTQNSLGGITESCPPFLRQMPAIDQIEMAGEGCSLGQIRGCELEFKQLGEKRFPVLDAQAGVTRGEAVLSFRVGVRGEAHEVELLAASTQGMARSALEFLLSSQFEPIASAARCGPYALPVRFSLYD